MTDYEKALNSVKDIPKFYLGQEVDTEIGRGIIVHLNMDFNGLYIQPEVATAVVWFSTSDSKGGWVNKSFKLSELKVNYRKEKLLKINKL